MMNFSPGKKTLIIYILLALATAVVYWQVTRHDFINFDDNVYVTYNQYVQSGLSLTGLRWAFSTTHAEFWHPLTWLSLMFDHQFYGLSAGGYHLTNLILHILNTLLLFWLFKRMTGEIWKSAFVAALFALHPLHVESVAWIAKRKDVLSAFFWMLTLCFYVYYTEKPAVKRYWPVLFSFVAALMSKPMVITLPVIMILLDYWPLKRFEYLNARVLLWQLKEKMPLFILSAIFSVITVFAHGKPYIKHFSFISRVANAPVSFINYIWKTIWPDHLAVFYPFPEQILPGQTLGALLLIIAISVAVVAMAKRRPYLFVGWFWYAITILPVLGIIQVNEQAMSDHYMYLPLIGVAVMPAWGIPLLFPEERLRKKILLPAGIILIIIMAFITWKQCAYWKNSFELFNHALRVTKNNYMAFNKRGVMYGEAGQYELAIEDFNTIIKMNPRDFSGYHNRGIVYAGIGQYKKAIEDCDKTISLKPDFAEAYHNRGVAYGELGQYQKAIEDFTKTIELQPDFVEAYLNRGIAHFIRKQNGPGCEDVKKACELGNCQMLDQAVGRKLCNPN